MKVIFWYRSKLPVIESFEKSTMTIYNKGLDSAEHLKCIVLTLIVNHFFQADTGIVPNLFLNVEQNERGVLIKLSL